MKVIFVIYLFSGLLFYSEACINPCAGTTPATCPTPACFNCGTCNTNCCQNTFFGRKIDENRGGGYYGGGFNNGFGGFGNNQIPCFFGGRSEEGSGEDVNEAFVDPGEKRSFFMEIIIQICMEITELKSDATFLSRHYAI